MKGPEDRARQHIDQLLCAAGWVLQDRADVDLSAALGVALRESPTTSPCDYLTIVNDKSEYICSFIGWLRLSCSCVTRLMKIIVE